jgi:phosphate transport system substrate-binding protein
MRRIVASILFLALASVACFAGTLNGAGATFPYPIYSKWFAEYNRLHPDVRINYQAIGSGGGIRQLLAGTVDFGAADGPMTNEQMGQSRVRILHIPTVLGSVVPAYNLPGIHAELKFTPQILAGIYMGKITTWNDKAIAAANPGVNLPGDRIVVIHRSDGSGTTFVFTDYLSKVSPEWSAQVGRNTSVKWPLGLGAKGNEGVAGMIRQMPNSIGYIELIYALQNRIAFGSVKNAAGVFVKPSLSSTTAAAASVKAMPADFRVSITNAPGRDAYPISTFTWLLVPVQSKNPANTKVIADFLNWMLDQGQKQAEQLSYAPLPQAVNAKVRAAVNQLHPRNGSAGR